MNRVKRDDTEHGVEYVRADEAQAEILEQCRINGMSAEREESLRAEVDRLNKAVADEREACAKVCERAIASIWEYSPEDVKQAETNVCNNLVAAIRARSNT